MKLFAHREIREAMAFALNGGQALHVWTPPTSGWPGAPGCFMQSRRKWAHLFDQDEKRLVATARRLGVQKIVVGSRGAQGQHVDLCGKPLGRAIEMAKEQPQAELPLTSHVG